MGNVESRILAGLVSVAGGLIAVAGGITASQAGGFEGTVAGVVALAGGLVAVKGAKLAKEAHGEDWTSTISDEGNDLRYAGFGLVIGLGVGTIIAVLLEAPFYYAGVGAMIGLIVGAAADSSVNSGE